MTVSAGVQRGDIKTHLQVAATVCCKRTTAQRSLTVTKDDNFSFLQGTELR